MSQDANEIREARDMALTIDNFYRTLPRAVGAYNYRINPSGAVIEVGEGTVTIELGTQQVRKIALLEIPWCRVEFVARSVSEEQFKEFSTRFHRHFQRGGG